MMPNNSLQSSMAITLSLRWLSMRLWSSLPTSPISDSLIPGKEQHKSSLHVSRRTFVYWIAWWKNLTKSLRPHASVSSNKLLSPCLTSDRFISWALFGVKRLILPAHSAIKAMMTCSRVLTTATILQSTQLNSAAEPTLTLHRRMMIFAWDPLILNQTILRMKSVPLKPSSLVFQAPCLATHPRFSSLGPLNLLTRSKCSSLNKQVAER